MNAPDFAAPAPINRTALAKESLDRLKQEWVSTGHRLGEAERELSIAEKAAGHRAETTRRFESGILKKIFLWMTGRLATTRQKLLAELAKAEDRLRLATDSVESARANKEVLRDTIAEMESDLKKPKLCETRLTDFRPGEQSDS